LPQFILVFGDIPMILRTAHILDYLRFSVVAAVLLAALLLLPCPCLLAAEINPFNTFDQSPLVQIYGLPAPGRAKLLASGENEVRVALDLANNFAHDSSDREAVFLDGETLRTTFSFARGFAGRFEAGVELPVVYQSGGFLDGFIEGWHEFFGLNNGTRASNPKDRLFFHYAKDGTNRLNFTKESGGIGDLRLTGATQLYRENGSALALRGLLKLPTGDSNRLLGSGSTDLALWLSADHDFPFETLGHAAIFGALGGLAKTRGDVLSDQERTFVGFGTLGAGWNPNKWLVLKLQLSSHTPFYSGSDFIELNAISTLLTFGGTIAFSDKTALDIGMSEDVAVDRSPDTTFHLALSTRF
jgi:hypothetical protein